MHCRKLFLIQVNKASTSLFFPWSSLMSVANFSAQRTECKGPGWGPAQGTGDIVGSLPWHRRKASTAPAPLQRAACAPEPQNYPKLGDLPQQQHPGKRIPPAELQCPSPLASSTVAGCPTSLLPCYHLCRPRPGEGPGSRPARCRSLHRSPHPACRCRGFPVRSSWGEPQPAGSRARGNRTSGLV